MQDLQTKYCDILKYKWIKMRNYGTHDTLQLNLLSHLITFCRNIEFMVENTADTRISKCTNGLRTLVVYFYIHISMHSSFLEIVLK